MYAYLIKNAAAFVCWDCLRECCEAHPYTSHSNGGGEADAPQHCDSCGVFLENPLTWYDGYQYVSAAIEAYEYDGYGTSVVEWADFYGLMCAAPGSGRRAQQYQAMAWPNGLASGRMMHSQARAKRLARYAASVITNSMEDHGQSFPADKTRGGIIEAYRPDINRHGFMK